MARKFLAVCLCWLSWAEVLTSSAAETPPPKPANYFNDYAAIVSSSAASELDQKLRQFERETSNQIVVAIFPKLESGSSVQDFTYRAAESWGVGQKGKNNGAVLFVFISNRKIYLQVGYGLEGALPDATCKRIIAEQIQPAFKAGNYERGLRSGIDAMFQATKGEYRGTGKVAGDRAHPGPGGRFILNHLFQIIFIIAVLISLTRMFRRGTAYDKLGRRIIWDPTFAGGSWSGGGFSGGNSSSGGGFSGDGGSFGGGGAGGDW